jgi:hypothetical protein
MRVAPLADALVAIHDAALALTRIGVSVAFCAALTATIDLRMSEGGFLGRSAGEAGVGGP